MNIPRLTQLRDHLRTLAPKRFDMRYVSYVPSDPLADPDNSRVYHDCKTVGCVAGHACALFGPLDGYAHIGPAARMLDLDYMQLTSLFKPEGWQEPGAYSIADAVQAINHLIETGEVKWPQQLVVS